jgi:glutathione peroxidase
MAIMLDYTMKRLEGQEENLAEAYKGKVLLLVNVASYCGNTPQYRGLQHLYTRYHDQGFEILGFPANDFGAQEPGTDEQIKHFCEGTYGVSFPMFSKITVKGPEMHPLYKEITSSPPPIGGDVRWNFQKYLVDREGNPVAKYEAGLNPENPAIVNEIEALLKD